MQTCIFTTNSAKDIPDMVATLVGLGHTIQQIVYCSGYKGFIILYV